MAHTRESLLVETNWLAAHLHDPMLRIVDIRGIIKPPDAPKPWYLPQREAYRQGHIPGADAANFAGSWYEWGADPSNPVQVGR